MNLFLFQIRIVIGIKEIRDLLLVLMYCCAQSTGKDGKAGNTG